MIFVLVLFILFPIAFGGTKCPERKDIYPCICINRAIGKKKMETTFVCRALINEDSLSAIGETLSKIEIDKFLLYDSFFQNDIRRTGQDQRIPVNVFGSFRIKEIEVVDTSLASFGCPADYNCNTNYLKRFSSINSTMTERDSCNNGNTIITWIPCPGDAEYIEIVRGLFTTGLKPEFFPQPMSQLKELRLPHNSISRIDKRTFSLSKFPKLHTLDLSYNSLRDLNIFASDLRIKFLDLSNNMVRTLGALQYLPNLHTLKLSNNGIKSLLENEWKIGAPSLRYIDLTNNSINCDCESKWINSTFHINTNFLGVCSSPVEVATYQIRRASRFLNEKCDETGNILVSRKKSKS